VTLKQWEIRWTMPLRAGQVTERRRFFTYWGAMRFRRQLVERLTWQVAIIGPVPTKKEW
jgi:hypothetical protein